MTVHAPSVSVHRAAIVAAFPDFPVFDYGRVPGLLDSEGKANPGVTPGRHVLFSIGETTPPSGRMGRVVGRTSWRVSLRAVGRASPANCRDVMDALVGLRGVRLTVDGFVSTPLVLEPYVDAAPDGGWYSSLLQFTYSV